MIKYLSTCALLAMSATLTLADDNGRVTFAAVEESVTVMSPTPRPGPNVLSPFTRLLVANIVVPDSEGGRSDLLITPSMVTAILTRTQNNGAKGPVEFAQASETITVQVLVDGVIARPGPVTYDNITRSNNTRFAGVISACTEVNEPTGQVNCTFTNEELTSILNEMGARSFNFFLKGVRPGTHRVEVQAAFTNDDRASGGTPPVPPPGTAPFASATSAATIGPRTLTVIAIQQGGNNDNQDENQNRTTSFGQSVSHIIDRSQR